MMKPARNFSTAIVLLMLVLLPAGVVADIDVGSGPTSDLWQSLMKKEYSLNVTGTPAIDVCKFFSKTTGFTFVCSEELSQERITIQMKAPFGKIYEVFLGQLHAECYFGATFAFIAQPNDPGLGKYPQPEHTPEKMRDIITFDFCCEKLSALAEFMVGVTAISVEFSPRLGSRCVTMYVQDIPFIDSMECLARYLKAPMRVEDGSIYGTVYIGKP